MYFLLLKYIFVEMEKGWYSYRGSLAYAYFITLIFITAIFQNIPNIFGLCNFWPNSSTAVIYETNFGQKVALMKEFCQNIALAK